MATQYDPTIFGYQNFYSATITSDITSGSLTIGLDTVPSPISGILVIDPDSATSREVILYTSKGASTVTCPSDGRGWEGTTATPHLQGTTVIMAPIDSWFKGLADGSLTTDPLRISGYLFNDFIATGGAVAQSAGLVGTFSNVTFYLSGIKYSGTSIANKTYTASKDTYVDITGASGGAATVIYTEVANGASSPALTAGYLRVAKVVTNGSAITSVTQVGTDTLTNRIYPTQPLTTAKVFNPYIMRVGANGAGTQSVGPASTITVAFTDKVYDLNNNYNTSTYKYTTPVAGFYRVSAHVRMDSGAATGMQLLFNVAGAAYKECVQYIPTADQTVLAGSDEFYVAAGQDIYIQVYNGNGTATCRPQYDSGFSVSLITK